MIGMPRSLKRHHGAGGWPPRNQPEPSKAHAQPAGDSSGSTTQEAAAGPTCRTSVVGVHVQRRRQASKL